LPWVAFITWPTSELNAFSLARAVVLDLLCVRGEDLIDDLFDGAGVADLLQAALRDDFICVTLPFRHALQDLLRRCRRDCAVSNAVQ